MGSGRVHGHSDNAIKMNQTNISQKENQSGKRNIGSNATNSGFNNQGSSSNPAGYNTTSSARHQNSKRMKAE